MVLLEGPYFIDLAKVCFKVISNCSSYAELCAWNSTSMARGQHLSHHRSELSVERQPASQSDRHLKRMARKVKDLKCYSKEGHNIVSCLLSLQKVAFHILDKQHRSTQCEKHFLKMVSESVHMSSIEDASECQASTKVITVWGCVKAYHGGI